MLNDAVSKRRDRDGLRRVHDVELREFLVRRNFGRIGHAHVQRHQLRRNRDDVFVDIDSGRLLFGLRDR